MFHLEFARCLLHWEKRGFSRSDLAKRVGCSLSAISHWANDRRPIRPDLARDLFRTFSEVFETERERESLKRLAAFYQEKFPDRADVEIAAFVQGKTGGTPRAQDPAQPEEDRPMVPGLKPALVVGTLLVGVALSPAIVNGLSLVWLQVWDDGRPQFISLFFWSLLFSSICLFVLGFDGKGARNRANWIERRAWRETYIRAVAGALDRIDTLVAQGSRHRPHAASPFSRNWSVALYEKLLAVAVLYPIFYIMIQWLVTGSGQTLGYFGGWPQEEATATRAVISGCFIGALVLSFHAGRQAHRNLRLGLGCLALVLNFTAYFLCWAAYGGVEVGPGAVNMAVLAFTLGVAFKLFDNVAVPAAAAGTAGAVLSFVFLPLVQVSEALTGQVGAGYGDPRVKAVHTILNHSLNLTLFFTLTWVFSRIFRKDRFESSAVFGVSAYVILSVGTAGMMFFAASQKFWAEYYLFLGLIPILNAVFDFLSVGLTRYTLRLGLERFGLRTLALGLFDLALAVLLLFSLVFFGVLLFHALNAVTGSTVVPVFAGTSVCSEIGLARDAPAGGAATGTAAARVGGCVAPLLSQMKIDPTPYAWLLGVFATTLLPTLCHLCFSMFALGPALLGPSVTSMIAQLSRDAQDDLFARLGASLSIGCWLSITVVALVGVMYGLGVFLLDPSKLFWMFDLLAALPWSAG